MQLITIPLNFVVIIELDENLKSSPARKDKNSVNKFLEPEPDQQQKSNVANY